MKTYTVESMLLYFTKTISIFNRKKESTSVVGVYAKARRSRYTIKGVHMRTGTDLMKQRSPKCALNIGYRTQTYEK